MNLEIKDFTRRRFNVVVDNGNLMPSDMDLFDLSSNEEVIYVPATADMFDILVLIGLFKSKGQAKKNWKATGQKVPEGWFNMTVGKFKLDLAILNPIREF